VIFADAANWAHARRWTNRQTARSAVRAETTGVLIVAEALHDTGRADIQNVVETLGDELLAVSPRKPTSAVLSRDAPRFEFQPYIS
jgi:DNA/RNA-binding domain of Phe-tRNA-synthetase-like protein